MRPDADHVLASVIDTFERYIAPEVHDEYAASLCLTVGQLLRSVRARVAHEGEALWDDNRELRELLGTLRPQVAPTVGGLIDDALVPAGDPDAYPSVARLQAEADRLRGALVACIEAIPDREHPARAAIRVYLGHQLDRQRPWLVDAFDGPRR